MKEQPWLIISIQGYGLSKDDKELIRSPQVAGVILFTRNFSSSEQLKELTKEIREIRPGKADFAIMVDHEGGAVQRFKKDGFIHLPPMACLGKFYEANPQRAKDQARIFGYIMASQLKEHRVDISLGPVVDRNLGNAAISQYGRAFHKDPEVIIALASEFITGMRAAGMPCTLKHFPGHGHDIGDSHKIQPIDSRTKEELAKDILIFKYLLSMAGAVMPAHIIYAKVDEHHTALNSKIWKKFLRKNIGFEGPIISDCMSMAGAKNESIGATQNNADLVLFCQQAPSTYKKILENTKRPKSEISAKRINFFYQPLEDVQKNQSMLQITEDVLRISFSRQNRTENYYKQIKKDR